LTRRYVDNGEFGELLSCAKAELDSMAGIAEDSPKNYHAWTYRLLVIRQVCAIANRQSDTKLINFVFVLLEREQTSIIPWLKRHVSDHSAASYGTVVLQNFLNFGQRHCEGVLRVKMFNNTTDPMCDNNPKGDNDQASSDVYRSWALSVVMKEIIQIRDFLSEQKYAGLHEVVWLYRRYCNAILIEVASSSKTLAKPFARAAVEWLIRKELAPIEEGFHIDRSTVQRVYDDSEAENYHQHAVNFIAWTVTQMYRQALTCDLSKGDLLLLDKIQTTIFEDFHGNDAHMFPYLLLKQLGKIG
jgi:hypothetical protein